MTRESFTFRAEQALETPDAYSVQSGIVYALLACCERLDRIAGALEPDVAIAAEQPARLQALDWPAGLSETELADDLEALLTVAREKLPISRLRRAMSAGLGPASVGVTGEPPHEEELDPRCGTPLMKLPDLAFGEPGVPAGAEIEAVCFLQQGHHGAHRSDRGHIWS